MTKANPELAKKLANANKKKANKAFDPDATKASGFKTNKVRSRQARKERDHRAANPTSKAKPAPNITAHGKPVKPISPILYKVGDTVIHDSKQWKIANIQPTKKGTLSVTLFRKPAEQKTIRINPYYNHEKKLYKL